VSTARAYNRSPTQTEGGRSEAFETSHFYLACFLRCTGYELIDLRSSENPDHPHHYGGEYSRIGV